MCREALLCARMQGPTFNRMGGMNMKRTILAVAAALSIFGVSASQAQSPVKVRISWVVPVNNSPTILCERPELMKHKGTTYEVDLLRFQGTPPMIQALGAGELD